MTRDPNSLSTEPEWHPIVACHVGDASDLRLRGLEKERSCKYSPKIIGCQFPTQRRLRITPSA
jgi:hypothetical protein